MAGEFVVMNKHLVKKLQGLNMWSSQMKDRIVADNGSIQNIAGIPENVKEVFKTVWELKQKALIDQAADRGIYICQTQSMNLFVPHPTVKTLSSMHFYSWSKGLKTGIYYLRTKPVASPIKFTVDSTDCASCGA